jgi:hypothetical protein
VQGPLPAAWLCIPFLHRRPHRHWGREIHGVVLELFVGGCVQMEALPSHEHAAEDLPTQSRRGRRAGILDRQTDTAARPPTIDEAAAVDGSGPTDPRRTSSSLSGEPLMRGARLSEAPLPKDVPDAASDAGPKMDTANRAPTVGQSAPAAGVQLEGKPPAGSETPAPGELAAGEATNGNEDGQVAAKEAAKAAEESVEGEEDVEEELDDGAAAFWAPGRRPRVTAATCAAREPEDGCFCMLGCVSSLPFSRFPPAGHLRCDAGGCRTGPALHALDPRRLAPRDSGETFDRRRAADSAS